MENKNEINNNSSDLHRENLEMNDTLVEDTTSSGSNNLQQSMKKAKSKNPVLLIDEIDKLYQSNMSDPSAAMLEVLDPEQNISFTDHYLDVEYSLANSFSSLFDVLKN